MDNRHLAPSDAAREGGSPPFTATESSASPPFPLLAKIGSISESGWKGLGKRNTSTLSKTSLASRRQSATTTVLDEKSIPEGHVSISNDLAISEAELANIKRIFDQFDANNSGTIDVGELQTCLKTIGHYLTLQQVEELMEEVTETAYTRELGLEDFVKLILFWKDTARFRLYEMAGSIHEQHIQTALNAPTFLTDAPWRWIWDLVILACTVYVVCSTPLYYVSRIREDIRVVTYIVDSIVSVVLFADVFIWSRTSFVVEQSRQLETETVAILKHYVTSWFIIDLLAAVPWVVIPSTPGYGLVWLRFLKVLRLSTLWQPSARVQVDSRYVNFHFKLLPLITGAAYFIMFVHSVAAIALFQDERLRYSTAVYYALYLVSGVGSGDVETTVDTNGKKWFTSCVMMSSMILNGYVVGNIVSYFQVSDVKGERQIKLRETSAVCNFFEIPEALKNEILQFQEYVLEHKLSVSYYDLICSLPDEMKTQLNIYIRMRLLEYHPLIGQAHQGVRVAIAQHLDECVFCPEEFVMLAGEMADEGYFIGYGFVDVASMSGYYFTTLKQMDHFGGSALFKPGQKRLLNVKALTYCDIFVLTREVFQGVLQRYPQFRRVVRAMENERTMNNRIVEKTKLKDPVAFAELLELPTPYKFDDISRSLKKLVFADQLSEELITAVERHMETALGIRHGAQDDSAAPTPKGSDAGREPALEKILTIEVPGLSHPSHSGWVGSDDSDDNTTAGSEESSLRSRTASTSRTKILQRKKMLAQKADMLSPNFADGPKRLSTSGSRTPDIRSRTNSFNAEGNPAVSGAVGWGGSAMMPPNRETVASMHQRASIAERRESTYDFVSPSIGSVDYSSARRRSSIAPMIPTEGFDSFSPIISVHRVPTPPGHTSPEGSPSRSASESSLSPRGGQTTLSRQQTLTSEAGNNSGGIKVISKLIGSTIAPDASAADALKSMFHKPLDEAIAEDISDSASTLGRHSTFGASQVFGASQSMSLSPPPLPRHVMRYIEQIELEMAEMSEMLSAAGIEESSTATVEPFNSTESDMSPQAST